MATIGGFRRADVGFEGYIETLSVEHSELKIVPNEGDRSDKAPDFLIFAGDSEIGCAWSKIDRNERPYLTCKIDDPGFTAPIYPNLLEEQNGRFTLVWTRSSR